MRPGLFGSAIIHLIVGALTMFAWSNRAELLPTSGAVVPVEIISEIGEMTNISAMSPEPLAEETPAEAGAPQEITPPVPETAEPVPDPRQPPRKKDEPRRPSTNTRDLASTIDLAMKEGRDPQNRGGGERGDRVRERIGAGTTLQVSEQDAVAAKIDRNWRNFDDLPDPERYRVQVRIVINADGSLAADPQVTSTSLPRSDQYMAVAVERSLRAILAAEPLPVSPSRTQRGVLVISFYKRT